MHPEQTKKRPHTTTEADEKNAKRRERYRDMPLAEKNALLLQRRLKYREAKTARLLGCLSPALSTPNSCSTSNTAAKLTVLHQFPASTKGNPLSIYEKGSTSGATNDNQHAPKLVTPSIFEKVEFTGCSVVIPTNIPQQRKEIICSSTVLKEDSRVILTTKNNFVNEINNMLIDKFPGEAKTFVGIDETIESDNQTQFEDLLHTLNLAGLPPYILSLKKNCPIMLLRNLNPYEGLCNGTRLTCCEFKTHVISAKIIAGEFKNTHVFIPRIPLLSSQDEKLPIQFKRIQFPIRLCFAMTINKAQGQTLDFVGIYLREPVFSHGQLYVALSRAKNSSSVKLLIRPPTPTSDDDHSTSNIVYDEIIRKAIQ